MTTPLRRSCKHCDKMFVPSGKFCRYCEDCNKRRRNVKLDSFEDEKDPVQIQTKTHKYKTVYKKGRGIKFHSQNKN